MTGANLAQLAHEAGFDEGSAECVDYSVQRTKEQRLYSSDTYWKILLARR